MAQRSQMYYAYFRFYVNESEITVGLEKHCTGWERMFAVGYNYHEYKCFVDNVGGFEHWVGDMRGYISQTRETGFIDGAPSDSVYDAGLMMGAEKTTDDDVMILNSVPRGSQIIFRKITGVDGGMTHKIKFTGGSSIITHPVMYTFDSNQIELFTSDADIVDDSDVGSYEFTADLPLAWVKGGIEDSHSGGTVTNFANMVDRDKATYGLFQNNAAIHTTYSLIIDMQESFNGIAVDFEGFYGDPWIGNVYLHTSPDKITWTKFGEQLYTAANREVLGTNNVDARYLKVDLKTGDSTWHAKVYIYRILVS